MASRRMNRTKSFGSYLNAINAQVSEVTARNEITSISAGAITGDALAENVTLFGSAIQSSDYVAGSTGWKIDGTGVAEFADVYIRGDINAETGTIGYWNISSPGVTRTIGDRVLFGTFLESNDFGEKDGDVTSGVYVGLFKSYYEDTSPVTSRIRTSNVATIRISKNSYQPGDQVIINVNEDTSFNNGGLPVTVISSTSESITYANPGSDYPTYDVNGIPASTVSTGTAVLYNPDVAGLYIKDYGKNSLDYGYFSNQGVAYVSASRVNLVHNPSFELDYVANVTAISGDGTTVTYTASNNFMAGQTVTITDSDVTAYNLTNATIASANSTAFTVTNSATGTGNTVANAVSRASSTSGWTFGNSASNVAVSVFRYSNLANQLLTSSTFATYASWTTSAPSTSRYFRGTINYSKGVDYHVFDLDKVLYLKYENHVNMATYSALYSSFSANASTCTITTTTAHGFSSGDLVAIDFKIADTVYGYNYSSPDTTTYPELLLSNSTTNIAIVQVTARTNTTFSYVNPVGSAPIGGVITTANDTRALRIYKVPYASVDLSQINFEFSNGQTTPIANVLNDMTTAAWTTTANKFMSLNPLLWFTQVIAPTDGVPPLQEVSSTPVMVDSNKLRLEYSTKDAAGYVAKNNITLNLPYVVYSQGANAITGNYNTSNIFYMSSNVAVSSISGNGTTVTYTTSAGNNLAVGDRVTITGATTTAYNLSNVAVATANTSAFTVTSTATGASSTASAMGYKTVTIFFDSVSFSTEPVPFFGNTSSDYSWEDPTLNSSNQISLQDTKKWLDINLDDQTGSISNLDYLGFKQSRLNIPLLSQPSIATTPDYNSDIGAYHSSLYDYENLAISGGVSSILNLAGDAYNNFESKVNLSSSKTKAAAQIIASFSDGTVLSDDARVTAYVDSQGDSTVEVDSDTFTVLSTSAVMGGSTTLYVDSLTTNNPAVTQMSFGSRTTFADIATFQSTLVLVSDLTTTGASYSATTAGAWITSAGYGAFIRDSNTALIVGRLTSGTGLVSFLFDGTVQGSISVSGTTVSYNSFLGSHYTETTNTDLLVGTVMETLDELVEGKYHSQERLPKAKISDTVASTKVYGVYFCEDEEDNGPNTGHLIAALGASKIRIAAGVSVSRGDLLESNGDGCAKVQADDIIRSSTIGKVTSATPVHTYEDGSYLVPCVLYCG